MATTLYGEIVTNLSVAAYNMEYNKKRGQIYFIGNKTTTIAEQAHKEGWQGSTLFRLHAPLVGGCRPIQLDSYFNQGSWTVEYRNVITQFGVPSEDLIARLKSTPSVKAQPMPKNGAAGL